MGAADACSRAFDVETKCVPVPVVLLRLVVLRRVL